MSRKRTSRKKQPDVRSVPDQVLSIDYWEGFYALGDHDIVLAEDVDGSEASYSIINLRSGGKTSEGIFPFGETTTFREFMDEVEKQSGRKITFRISDTVENPDRHEELCRIVETGDRFQIARIQNLIKRIRCKGICVYGGRMGGRLLENGEYEGFYLLDGKTVLYCREAQDWDETNMTGVVDGAVSYYMLDPARFDISASRENFFGYLLGDRFSDLLTSVCPGTRTVTELDTEGGELYGHLLKALNGDADSAAIASHRLKLNLCIRR